MEQQFKQIPEVEFKSTYNSSESVVAVITQNSSGTFLINTFVAVQLLKGILLQEDAQPVMGSEAIARGYKFMTTLTKLVLYPDDETQDKLARTKTKLERNEVEYCRNLLETSMSYCEEERDNDDPKFNSLTYIGMKILLLEIKQWLMGDIIKVKGPAGDDNKLDGDI